MREEKAQALTGARLLDKNESFG